MNLLRFGLLGVGVLTLLWARPVSAAPLSPAEMAFQSRAQALTRWLADDYRLRGSAGTALNIPQEEKGPPDPQKDIWPKVMARLTRDPHDAWSHAMIGQFWNDGGEPAPHAASFYHFAAYGLVRLMFQFPEAVAPYRRQILARAMQEDQLFHGDGTENHIAMWRTSGYLFAQEAGDVQKTAEMKAWMTRYAARLFAHGQGEFDSSTYFVFAIASWLNIADFARDSQVRTIAHAVVDYFAAALALKYTNGVEAGAEKRGFSGRSNAQIADFVGWLWWGDTSKPSGDQFLTREAIYTIFPALSRYRPAPAIAALAHKATWTKAERYRLSSPNYAMTIPSQTRQTLYITPHYSVGISYSPTGGWGGGDTQETLWKFAARGDAQSQTAYVISGAGSGYAATGYIPEGRSPWDQIAQNDDIVVQMTDVPENAAQLMAQAHALFDQWKMIGSHEKATWASPAAEPWAFAAFPAAAQATEKSGALFLDCGDAAYAAIRPLRGAYTWITTGLKSDDWKAIRCDGQAGQVLGFAYEFGDRDTDGSFERFEASVLAKSLLDTSQIDQKIIAYADRHGHSLKTKYQTSGTFAEPEYDWGQQPAWPFGEGWGRVPQVWQDGKALDLTSRWPVYDGPRLHLDRGNMRVGTGRAAYWIRVPASLPLTAKREKP